MSANLKNTVTKPMAAKMLAALAEKGELTAKTYGKATIYCITQVSSRLARRGSGQVGSRDVNLRSARATPQMKLRSVR